jgi:HlyD family secretion protein
MSVLEKAGEALAMAEARTRAARSQRAMAEADRSAARALAQTFRDIGSGADSVVITAPAGGQVLRLLEESETTLPAGAPVMEIGDVDGDLEVIAELLSRDAVAVKAGMPVVLDAWGGTAPLAGEVIRIEPSGFTKFSALGVEEQRVNVIIGFRSPPAARAGLGAGYRLVARIKTYEAAGVLTAPSTALVRKGNDWIVFLVRQGRALETPVTVIANNGLTAEIQGEVDESDLVVLHPTPDIRSGQRLTARKTGP